MWTFSHFFYSGRDEDQIYVLYHNITPPYFPSAVSASVPFCPSFQPIISDPFFLSHTRLPCSTFPTISRLPIAWSRWQTPVYFSVLEYFVQRGTLCSAGDIDEQESVLRSGLQHLYKIGNRLMLDMA